MSDIPKLTVSYKSFGRCLAWVFEQVALYAKSGGAQGISPNAASALDKLIKTAVAARRAQFTESELQEAQVILDKMDESRREMDRVIAEARKMGISVDAKH
ncbi:MAG: hypothetical protein ACTSX8_08490 [Alphaproteobacteria bacterium]